MMKPTIHFCVLTTACVSFVSLAPRTAAQQLSASESAQNSPNVSFTAVSPKGDLLPVILQWDEATKTGFDWHVIRKLKTDDRRPDNVMRASVE